MAHWSLFTKTKLPLRILSLGCIFSLIAATVSYGQQDTSSRPNSVYLELGGAGVLYSLNYERLIYDRVAVRAGASNIPAFGGIFIFPATVSVLFDPLAATSRPELGAGITYVTTGVDSSIDATAIIGFRHRLEGSRFFLRAALIPYLSASKGFNLWAGAAVGYSF